MESPPLSLDSLRYKLILGKFAVTKIERIPTGLRFAIHFPGLGHVICDGPLADVREGDLLTLYTEILSNAKSS